MKRWTTRWQLEHVDAAVELMSKLWGAEAEVWEIRASTRPKDTWRAYVIKHPEQPIVECRDPHYAYLLDDPVNYRRIR